MNLRKSLCLALLTTNALLLTMNAAAQQSARLNRYPHKKQVSHLMDFPGKNILHDMIPVSDDFAVPMNQSGNYDFAGLEKLEAFYNNFAFIRSDTLVVSKELHQSFAYGKDTLSAVIDIENENKDMYLSGYKSLTLSNGKGEKVDLLSLMWQFGKVEQENRHRIEDLGATDNATHQKQKESYDILCFFVGQFEKYKQYYLRGETNLKIAGQTYTAL